MNRFKKIVRKLFADEDGAALAEYGLLVGLIAVVCITAIAALGTRISEVFDAIVTQLVDPVPG
jgi:pilus assembly protein Flp/PilA